jgi:hypothetical protein
MNTSYSHYVQLQYIIIGLNLIFLSGNLSTDFILFEESISLQEADFRAPELMDGSWKQIHAADTGSLGTSDVSSGKKCGWSIDIFAMGKLLQKIYANENSATMMPKCLETPVKRMLSPDHRRRPTCASLLKAPW